MSLPHCLGRVKLSVQVRDTFSCFVIKPVCMVRSCQHLAQHPSWRTTPFWLSATAYSIYSQLPNIFLSSLRNLRTRHAVMIGTQLSWATKAHFTALQYLLRVLHKGVCGSVRRLQPSNKDSPCHSLVSPTILHRLSCLMMLMVT